MYFTLNSSKFFVFKLKPSKANEIDVVVMVVLITDRKAFNSTLGLCDNFIIYLLLEKFYNNKYMNKIKLNISSLLIILSLIYINKFKKFENNKNKLESKWDKTKLYF